VGLAMTDTWFTADFHLGHQNIIRYCDRPFQTLAEMDAAIVDRLNSSVKESDILYFLGDFCRGTGKIALDYRERIRCQNIFFIEGNHDDGAARSLPNSGGLSSLQRSRSRVNSSCCATMPCGYGITRFEVPGIYMGIRTAASRMTRLRYPWTLGWILMISARGISTRSECEWARRPNCARRRRTCHRRWTLRMKLVRPSRRHLMRLARVRPAVAPIDNAQSRRTHECGPKIQPLPARSGMIRRGGNDPRGPENDGGTSTAFNP
jgi:hypothetical protein